MISKILGSDLQSCLAVGRGKKVPIKICTGLGTRGPLKGLNDTKLILNNYVMLILDQFGIIQNLYTSLIHHASFLTGTFFANSYSKADLVMIHMCMESNDNQYKGCVKNNMDCSAKTKFCFINGFCAQVFVHRKGRWKIYLQTVEDYFEYKKSNESDKKK